MCPKRATCAKPPLRFRARARNQPSNDESHVGWHRGLGQKLMPTVQSYILRLQQGHGMGLGQGLEPGITLRRRRRLRQKLGRAQATARANEKLRRGLGLRLDPS
eukprot:3156630-Pyramimonas_sp.AAC.1